ncbi:unnamed protein product [Zymoseptoria tritici ST99CH_1E4]|uniref:Peptidase A1 domain-containing protein n=1 Tax=Zymoseptoria tritici ST99CH_1E4 TaxID=1276532 RepID=A0A2H1GBV7_ZYMTR|nr:unnamed protein product [Zymoseptoria tritici ST99CH_1E4]
MSTSRDKTNHDRRSDDGGTESSPSKTHSGESNGNNNNDTSDDANDAKKPNQLKQLWTKAGLDASTLILMLKGSLPPTIAIAMYQSPAVAAEFTTLGYLVAIAATLGMCILPRGMFVQTMMLNVVSICVAAAVCLFSLWCGIRARTNTTPAGAPPTGYNSSASAVLAIFLIVQTFLVNTLRAARPQFQFPVILYSIFAIVSTTYGTQFPTMAYAESFMRRLLIAFLSGFGIATGVSLFVFPISSRMVVFKEMAGYLNGLSGLLKAQGAYLQSLEDFDPHVAGREQRAVKKGKKSKGADDEPVTLMTPEGRKLKGSLEKLYGLYTKIPTDIGFAKREVAIGKLEPKDISGMWKLMRAVMTPIGGLNAVIDILQRRAEAVNGDHPDEETQRRKLDDLHHLMKSLHEPFAMMSSSIGEAFQHVLLTFELTKPPKKKKSQDEESSGNEAAPGTPGFAEAFKAKIDLFYENKKQGARDWCTTHNINMANDFSDASFIQPGDIRSMDERETNQRQLFFALYVEYLLHRAGLAALDLVLYADERKQAGTLKKTKLIVPRAKTLRKWVRAAFGKEDKSDDDQYTADMDSSGSRLLDLGQSYGKRKDPEHMPPRNWRERIGEMIRLIPRGFRSDASSFGFRVTWATMSVAIICFLEATQSFFLKHRLLWAMIMVPISMTRTAGQSTWSFALRIIGTAIAMVASYVIWYIVDGKTAGVIVFLWLWLFCAFYFLLKFPKLIIVGLISAITAILVVGYELQVKQVGVAISESNGQPAYETYVLAPYRLATVCGGLAVAYIWTIFPYPISESTELRKDLGAAIYLLANLYSVVHETVTSRIQRIDGDEDTKGTRAYHLEQARRKVFTKLLSLLTTLRQNSAFSKFQLRVGGRFPQEEYEGLIGCVERVLQYTALISYASGTFSTSAADSEWSVDFRKLLQSVDATSHQFTSLLSLLSSSLAHARPLPPYLEVPQHRRYVRSLEKIDHDILSVSHIAEPEYSAFAVIQICAQCINDDVVKMTRHVKFLVGEIDFSFHVVSTSSDSSDGSSTSSKASTITTVSGSPQILREADNVARSSGQELRARTSLNKGLDVPIAPHSLPLKRLDTNDYAGVNAASLRRRSTPNTGNAASPLYALGPRRGFAIDIQVGQDTYPVFLDTGSSNAWLPSPDFKCIDFDYKTVLTQDACGFAKTLPSDYTFSGGEINDTLLGMSYNDGEVVTGRAGYETITVAGVTVPRVVLGLAENATYYGDGYTCGLMGLSWPLHGAMYSATTSDTVLFKPFIFEAIDQGLIAPMFSHVLDVHNDYTGPNAGQLTLGGKPADVESGDFVEAPLLLVTDTPLTAPPLPLPIDKTTSLTEAELNYIGYIIRVDGYNIVPPTGGEPHYVSYADDTESSKHVLAQPSHIEIDSGNPFANIPDNVVNATAALFDPPARWDDEAHGWVADCDAAVPSIALRIDGVDLWFEKKALLSEPISSKSGPDYCYLGVQGDNGSGLASAGVPWLQGLVTVYDIGNKRMLFAQRTRGSEDS